MCTNGSGTNSVKPPVSFCSVAGAHEVAGDVHRPLDVPNMIVTFERSPTECAVRCASSHSSVLTLSGQMTARTSSSRISAAVPGSVARPGVLQRARGSRASGMPSRRAPSVTSSAVKPCTWIVRRDLLHRAGDVDR